MRKKIFDSRKGSQVRSQNRDNDHFGYRTEFFFFVEKKVDLCVFRGQIYRRLPEYCNHFNIISGSQSNSKKPNFLSLFDCSPWSRNNYVMIPTTWSFPVNFTPKNYTSKWNFEKKNFRFPKGVSGSVSKSRKRRFWDIGGNFFFLWKKKLTIMFFGVKFTGDYRNIAIVSTLFRDHSQSSKKPNFLSFFRLFTVIPKWICNDSNDMVIPGEFHPKKLYE